MDRACPSLAFHPLHGAVVVMRTKALPVGAVPKQALVALMGDHVVNHGRRLIAACIGAARIGREECLTRFLPFIGVAAMMRVWPALVETGFTLLPAQTLTGADDASLHDFSAGADAWGCKRHYAALFTIFA